jgi:putative serine protease PepD
MRYWKALVRTFLPVPILVALVAGCAPGGAGGSAALYERARRASAEVLVGGRLEGSGWFADSGGLVMTAAHVVWQKKGPIEVVSPTEGRLAAQVFALDLGHDLALLTVARRAKPYAALAIAQDIPAPGEDVYLFAAPMFRHNQMIRGTPAEVAPTYEYSPVWQDHIRVYHITGPSPRGTSGGCWIDRQGRVVGSQSGMISERDISVGVCYATSPQDIRRFLESRRMAATAYLGVVVEELQEQSRELIARFPAGQTGLVVTKVRADGPAMKAGLARDSLILAVDGRNVAWRDEFLEAVRARKPGDSVTLKIIASPGTSPRDVKVVLGCLEEAGKPGATTQTSKPAATKPGGP